MASRKVKPEEKQSVISPIAGPVLAKPESGALDRKRQQRDKLIGMRDELLAESLGVIRDAMRFRDIDPEFAKEIEKDPAFWDMEDELGAKDAKKAYRVAQYASMTAADAPIGLKLATNIAVGIMKANAAEKGGTHVLNVNKVVLAAHSLPVFEEREVESE